MNNSPANLQQLILNNKRDRTYEQLSKDSGNVATKSTIQRLATQTIKDMPTTAVMKGLARSLRVRLSEVVEAAAVSVGLNLSAQAEKDLVILGGRTLPTESQQLLMSMAENMLWWNEQLQLANASAEHEPEDANIHHMFPEDETRLAADAGDKGIDPEQLPED